MSQYVQGYYRNKESKQNLNDASGPALLAAASGLVMFAVVFWQVTMAVLVVAALTYAGHLHYQRRLRIYRQRLQVNLNGRREYV